MTKTESLKIESCDNGYIIEMVTIGKKSVAKNKNEVCAMIADSLKGIIPDEKDIENKIS